MVSEVMHQKKAPPWLKLYPADLLVDGDIDRLSLEELGLLGYLLLRAWVDGGIPASLDELGRYARLRRMRPAKLARLWRGIEHCWTPHPGNERVLVNLRLEIARRLGEEHLKNKSRAGKISAARRRKTHDKAPAHV